MCNGAAFLDFGRPGRDLTLFSPSRGDESGSAVHSDDGEDKGEDGSELGESFLRPTIGLLLYWNDSEVGVLGGEGKGDDFGEPCGEARGETAGEGRGEALRAVWSSPPSIALRV